VIVVGYRIRPEDFRQHCYSLAAGDHYVRQTSVGHTQVVVTADGTARFVVEAAATPAVATATGRPTTGRGRPPQVSASRTPDEG